MHDSERRYPRIKNLSLVQISRFDEEEFRADLATGRTLDLSHGGMRLELDHPLPLNSIVDLTLALENQILDVRGKIVYLKQLSDERCMMGIEFSELSAKAAALIDRHVEKSLPGNGQDDSAT